MDWFKNLFITSKDVKQLVQQQAQIKPDPVRYFMQSEFDDRYKDQDKTFNRGFGHDVFDKTDPNAWVPIALNTACHVTANLNEISEEYTKVTGKSMTKGMAEAMLDNALKNGSMDVWGNIKKDSATAEFFNDAWSVTGLEGAWEKNDKGDHTVYKTDRYGGNHYESNGPTGSYQDPWSGKEKSLPEEKSIEKENIFHYQRKEK